MILIPYLALYVKHLAQNLAWMPLGDDYPIHVYFALEARENPTTIFTTHGGYPSLIHLLGFLVTDPLALGRLYAIYGALLIAAGAVFYGAYTAQLTGSKPATLIGAAAVIGSVRTLAGIIDGQLADKTVLLIVIPLSLMLYAKGHPTAALLSLAPVIFINYLGVAYAAALALAYAIYGGKRPKIAIALLATAGVALLHDRITTVAQLAQSAFAQPPPIPWDPLWGLIYAFYGPSAPILAATAAYIAVKAKHAAPLALASLTVLAAALTAPLYGERLMRIAALMMPVAAAAGLLETGHRRAAALTLAVYLAGPAAAGWAWATGHLDGLFAPVQRLTPDKLQAYTQALALIPPNATVQVMWQLDLWLLPIAKTQRPDLNVEPVSCTWGKAQYYVYTTPDPRQWHMPCTHAAGPPPGKPLAKWHNTTLYAHSDQ